MPVILLPEYEELWLDQGQGEPEVLLPLLRPYPVWEMEAYPVSLEVNSPANDSPDLLELVPAPRAMAATVSGGPSPL